VLGHIFDERGFFWATRPNGLARISQVLSTSGAHDRGHFLRIKGARGRPIPPPLHMTHATGAPVSDNLNIQTAGPRGPALLQDIWLIEKLANFDREVIPERRMHAKGAGRGRDRIRG
jgi:hypothetical protein